MSVQLWSSADHAAEGQVSLSSAEALLCDMDGTLVDSSAVVESMWDSFARDYGMSERFDEIMAYSPGRTGIDTIRRFLPELTAEEQDAIHKRFAREEIVLTAGRMAEIPGAAAFITALIDAGVPLALVTSAPIELMRVRMEEACVPIPPVVVSADDVDRGKPDPAPYLKAAELLDVPISSCLVLEDAASGYTAARRAGAQVLLVGDRVPEATPDTPRIADFTGITVTIHSRRAGYFSHSPTEALSGPREVPGSALSEVGGQWACWPFHRAWPRSRLRREMTSSGTDLGHTAAHSPMFVQPPKPSASCWLSMLTTRARRSG